MLMWIVNGRKLVIIGDGACGKTSLLSVFTLGYFPTVSNRMTYVLGNFKLTFYSIMSVGSAKLPALKSSRLANQEI